MAGPTRLVQGWRSLARQLKAETYALYLAYRDPRTPWYARVVAGLVVAYALSPVDLIPDPVPILGHLDDLVLIPLGIMLAIRLLPKEVLDDARRRAGSAEPEALGRGLIIVLTTWVLLLGAGVLLIIRLFGAG